MSLTSATEPTAVNVGATIFKFRMALVCGLDGGGEAKERVAM